MVLKTSVKEKSGGINSGGGQSLLYTGFYSLSQSYSFISEGMQSKNERSRWLTHIMQRKELDTTRITLYEPINYLSSDAHLWG